MGTANFHYVNADRAYVIHDSCQDEEYGIFRLDWGDVKWRIEEFGESQEGWEKDDRSFRFGMECDTAVLRKEFEFEYSNSNLRYSICAYLTINCGYYECWNLDYRFVFPGNSCDEDFDDIVEQMVDDFANDYTWCTISDCDQGKKTWNLGLRKMQVRNFRKAADDFLFKVKEECEQMCLSLCDEPYKLIGSASNGEAFYERC